MKIGLLAFSSAASTMGLEIVADSVRDAYPSAVVVVVDETSAKSVDYLLVSLYWWRDAYALMAFLARAGIDPRKRKPVIIIGGMSAVNPRPLTGYYHYAVIGDGEDVIGPLLKVLENNEDPSKIRGVWNTEGCSVAVAANLPSKFYTEIRQTVVTRVELARGCKMKCAFCQLSAMKPYRETPLEILRHMILSAPTKKIALFAPDRGSYSRLAEVDAMLKKLGKRCSGSDIRLTMIKKQKTAEAVRFGIEAFSATGRKLIMKPMPADGLLEHLQYISNDLRTPKGKNISMATAYVIGDLPGEQIEDNAKSALCEFWDVLNRWDSSLKSKFTLFLSTSSFAPSPFTTLERAGINPYSRFGDWFKKTRPRFNKLIIATRGGLIGPSPRLCQMLSIRGDEKTARAMFYIATKESKLLKDTSEAAGKRVEAIVKSSGYDPKWLYEQWPEDRQLPWGHITRPWVDPV